MSDNPFANHEPATSGSPLSNAPAPAQYQKTGHHKPKWLTIIFVLCLLFGLLGLFGNALTIAAPILGDWLQGIAGGNPNMTEEMKQAEQELREYNAEQFLPALLFALMNFIVAPLLLVGGVLGLRGSPAALKLLNIGLIMAMVFVTLRLIYNGIVQVMDMERVMDLSLAQMGPEAENLRGVTEITMWVVLGLGVLFAVGKLLIYGLSWLRLRSPEVQQYFAVEKLSS